jgi:tetratricopeptide (TPR) repeat protein
MARSRTICLLLALVTVLAYLPVRNAGLVVFDDPLYVQNLHVKAGLTWAGIKWAFTTWYGSNWHPLTWLSHMLDASLFGDAPGPQHLINVLIHAANAILLFLLLVRITGKKWPAAFVAALFAWHPLHVESVAWISERKDVLSTFFGLLTLITYARYAEKSKVQSPKSKVWYAWSLAFFALSLLAKPMLVTLPFVLLLLDIWPLKRIQTSESTPANSKSRPPQHATRNTQHAKCDTFPRLVLEKLPFFALTIASCLITFLAQRDEAVVSIEERPLGLRFANALVAYAEYLGKTFWPAKLAIIYPLPNQIPVWQIITAAMVLAAISFLVWRARKTSPFLLVGWFWFLGTLVPVIGIVQVGGQALADRYTYVPLIGVFIAVAYGVAELTTRFRLPTAAISATAAGVLIACLCVTEYQLRFWHDSQTLFSHALAVTKNNAVAHINLGVALEQENLPAQALQEYRQALAIDPHRFQVHNNLANLLSATGSHEEALKEYQEALRLNPDAESARVNFGTELAEMGRFDDALAEYTKAAQLAPEDPRPFYLMGKACLRHGQSADAIKHFRDALRLEPENFETLTWLARVLAADQNPDVRNGVEAISFAEHATNLTGAQQPFVLDTLAMAYAEANRFNDAIATAQKAIQLATAARAQKTLPEMEHRLQLYQGNQPYREDFSKTLSPSK